MNGEKMNASIRENLSEPYLNEVQNIDAIAHLLYAINLESKGERIVSGDEYERQRQEDDENRIVGASFIHLIKNNERFCNSVFDILHKEIKNSVNLNSYEDLCD